MAELAGVFAASHGPLIARDWHVLPQPLRERMTVAFRELGRRFGAKKIDALFPGFVPTGRLGLLG